MTKELKLVFLIVGIVLVALGAGFFMLQDQQKNAPKIATSNTEALFRETPNVKNNKDAKIVITEFADLQCPACAQTQPAIEALQAEYGDKIKFVFRHFPLNIHPNAKNAAAAAEAAGEQGKFFEMISKLYARQNDWSTQPAPTQIFRQIAQELGLDMTRFDKALGDEYGKARIIQDQADGTAIGVNATPTFFFNDEQITTGGINQVRSKIEEALKGSEAPSPAPSK